MWTHVACGSALNLLRGTSRESLGPAPQSPPSCPVLPPPNSNNGDKDQCLVAGTDLCLACSGHFPHVKSLNTHVCSRCPTWVPVGQWVRLTSQWPWDSMGQGAPLTTRSVDEETETHQGQRARMEPWVSRVCSLTGPPQREFTILISPLWAAVSSYAKWEI